MTQMHRTKPGQRSGITRRPGFVYAYDTLRLDGCGMVANTGTEVGYVGKTVQRLSARDDQHRGIAGGPDGTPAKCQPFSDLIVGGIRVLERGVWTEDELAEREQYWIGRLRPRYNVAMNWDNTLRVPLPVSRRWRDARDAVRSVVPQRWAPARRTPSRVRRVLRSRWTWWLAVWFVAMVALAVVDVHGQKLTLREAACVAAAIVGVIRVWWWLSGHKRWRRWMRRR